MKLSIVIPVLNSHEIVRRQLLHWGRILPADVEVVLVDDGSDPPIVSVIEYNPQVKIIETNDRRPWTQPKARNIGVKYSTGDTLLMTDIDHIVVPETLEFAATCRYDYGRFRRSFGVLDENGNFTQDARTLIKHGLPASRVARGLRLACHTLSMVIRRTLFEEIGGYPEDRKGYPTHDDGYMKRQLKKRERAGEITKCPDDRGNDQRAPIYMFPNGRFCGDRNANPLGLFHSLERCR